MDFLGKCNAKFSYQTFAFDENFEKITDQILHISYPNIKIYFHSGLKRLVFEFITNGACVVHDKQIDDYEPRMIRRQNRNLVSISSSSCKTDEDNDKCIELAKIYLKQNYPEILDNKKNKIMQNLRDALFEAVEHVAPKMVTLHNQKHSNWPNEETESLYEEYPVGDVSGLLGDVGYSVNGCFVIEESTTRTQNGELEHCVAFGGNVSVKVAHFHHGRMQELETKLAKGMRMKDVQSKLRADHNERRQKLKRKH